MKFENFNESAKRVMQIAHREARSFKHHYIGTEHVLLGLLGENSEVVAEVFQTFGVNADTVRAEIEKLLPPGPAPIGAADLPLTPRAKQAIEYARREAETLGLKSIDSEHLLLGLVYEPGGVAGKVLRNLGVKLELLGPAVFRLRLEQMKIVERVVRPVRAVVQRKRKMREELLGHLAGIYEEENARLRDSSAALAEAGRRLGEARLLTKELEQALPSGERFAYWFGRFFEWRAPESAARYCARLGINMIFLLACMTAPMVACFFLTGMSGEANPWLALRLEVSFVLMVPTGLALLTWVYFKMRDAMWGAFGSRKSVLRVGGFAVTIAIMTFVFMLVFFGIQTWNLGNAVNSGNAVFYLDRAAAVGVGCAVFYIITARLNGPREIADAIWGSLKVD